MFALHIFWEWRKKMIEKKIEKKIGETERNGIYRSIALAYTHHLMFPIFLWRSLIYVFVYSIHPPTRTHRRTSPKTCRSGSCFSCNRSCQFLSLGIRIDCMWNRTTVWTYIADYIYSCAMTNNTQTHFEKSLQSLWIDIFFLCMAATVFINRMFMFIRLP